MITDALLQHARISKALSQNFDLPKQFLTLARAASGSRNHTPRPWPEPPPFPTTDHPGPTVDATAQLDVPRINLSTRPFTPRRQCVDDWV